MVKRPDFLKNYTSRRLELRHLRYFAVAAQECHFGRAARRLNVSTPAVSRQIQDLENILGVQLFERLSRGTVLSREGHLFLEEANRILDDVDETVRRFVDGGQGEMGSLKIGINDGASWSGAMPNSIRQFRGSHPNVQLELLPMSSTVALEAVMGGEIHMAFVQSLSERHESLCYQDVEVHRVMLALHELNPLAHQKHLRLADLANEPFVLLSRLPNSFYYEQLLESCARGGLQPRVLQEVHKESSLLSLVSTGMAVGWVLAPASSRRPEGVVLREVEDLHLMITLALIWRARNRSSLIARFVETVRDACTSVKKV
jgi:DNA-binding transcriptional LysR family regulator